MKIAAIVTEYNPFHNGHEYQIKKIREILGSDTAIIAIMSGNFTQRGELAITDKSFRAKAAVECGVNLVLELPFPYSMSSAEFFAKSGVHIANSLGVVDYLVFGSECGDTEALKEIAENMLSEKFIKNLKEKEAESENIGYASLCERVYAETFDKKIDRDFFTSNNILAIEYIKALASFKSKIKPLTIKRLGGAYSSLFEPNSTFQSAKAIREMLLEGNASALDFVPENAKKVYQEAVGVGEMPILQSNLDTAVISKFRLNSPLSECDIHDASGGLYNRLYKNSMTATTISSLISMSETKKYTKARIRRAVWNSYFGVTSSELRELPCFTQILAMDTVGRSLLKDIKTASGFTVLTKPASYLDCSPTVIAQKELSNKADSIFDLARKTPISGAFALTFTPYVKK